MSRPGAARPPPPRRPGGGAAPAEGPCACCATYFAGLAVPQLSCGWLSGDRVQLWCNILLGLFTFVADVAFVFALGAAEPALPRHFIAGIAFMVATIVANTALVLRVVCKLFGQQEELRAAMSEHIMSYAAVMALATTNVEVLNVLVNRAKETDTYIRVVSATLVSTVLQARAHRRIALCLRGPTVAVCPLPRFASATLAASPAHVSHRVACHPLRARRTSRCSLCRCPCSRLAAAAAARRCPRR